MSGKKSIALFLTAIMILGFTSCGDETKNVESADWTSDWEPYYTGDKMPVWQHDDIEPWETSQEGKFFESWDQSKGMTAHENLTAEYPGITDSNEELYPPEDYAGSFLNASGTLTIMLVNPTKELSDLYGEVCKAGIWVIAAQYSLNELKTAESTAFPAIRKWIEENPDADVGLSSCGVHQTENRVYISLYGLDCGTMEMELGLPNCVSLSYDIYNSSVGDAVPYEPVSATELKAGVTAELDSSYYPVGLEYIICTVRNKTDEEITYGFTPIYYKYHKGEWQLVPGNYGFSLIGYTLFPHTKTAQNILSSDIAKRMGPGLYRVYPWGDWSGDNFFLEFVVTEDAEEQKSYNEVLTDFTSAEGWEWFSLFDVWNMDFDGFQNDGTVCIEGNYEYFLILRDGDSYNAYTRGMRFGFIDLRTGETAYITGRDELYAFYIYYLHGDGKVSIAGSVNGKPGTVTASFENGKIVYYDEPFPVEKYMDTEEVQGEYFNCAQPAITEVWSPRSVEAGTKNIELTVKYKHPDDIVHLDTDMWLARLTEYGLDTVFSYCGSIHENVSQQDSVSVALEFEAPLEPGLYRLYFKNIRLGIVNGSEIDYYNNDYYDTWLGFNVE